MKIDTQAISFGDIVQDSVTGFSGTATAVCAYVTGCSQILVQPECDKKNGWKDPRWFDCTRLTIIGTNSTVVTLAVEERNKAIKGERVGGPGNPSEAPPIR